MRIKREDVDNRKVDFACALRRNPSRRVPEADEDQRLRTCQCAQSTPHMRQ
jgi:hypothetical protein